MLNSPQTGMKDISSFDKMFKSNDIITAKILGKMIYRIFAPQHDEMIIVLERDMPVVPYKLPKQIFTLKQMFIFAFCWQFSWRIYDGW